MPLTPQAKFNIILYSILLGLLFIVFGIISYSGKSRKDSILAHKKFTVGTITRVNSHTYPKGNGGYLVFEYKFMYLGDISTSERSIPKGCLRDSLIGKTFPIIYDSAKVYSSTPNTQSHYYIPGPGDLLITPIDFKEYNMPFPDSLNWVLKYLGESK